MIFKETELPGAYLIELECHEDDRGFFARTFCRREFADLGLESRIAQCNISYNRTKGTLRGLHYQAAPHQEAKLVACVRGAIFDVIVDLRETSPTWRQWYSVVLTEDRRNSLYVPENFAHGFLTLADDTEVSYQMTADYEPESARGLRWDDPALAISWPEDPVVISAKDRGHPLISKM